MQLNGSHTATAGTAKAIIHSLSSSVWGEAPQPSAEEGKAAGESMQSVGAREIWSLQV